MKNDMDKWDWAMILVVVTLWCISYFILKDSLFIWAGAIVLIFFICKAIYQGSKKYDQLQNQETENLGEIYIKTK